MNGAESYLVAVRDQDDIWFQRARLLPIGDAVAGAARALLHGAREVSIWPDLPKAALLEGRLSGDVELMGDACRMLGEDQARELLALDDEAAISLVNSLRREGGGYV